MLGSAFSYGGHLFLRAILKQYAINKLNYYKP